MAARPMVKPAFAMNLFGVGSAAFSNPATSCENLTTTRLAGVTALTATLSYPRWAK